jgi:transposase-like protein
MKKAEVVVRIRRRNAQEKSRILSAYRESGQTQKVFCRTHAISVPTLAAWLKRARQLPPMSTPGSGLLEVPVFGRAGGEVVIELGAGLSVRAPVGSPVAWLRELMGALRCGG